MSTNQGTSEPSFTKTPGWLDWMPEPSQPQFRLPHGAVDTHCHVFGPGQRFPYAPERKYTPCDASKDQLFALHRTLGIRRRVIVQATCHGSDNRAMVDAVLASGTHARGVATLRADVTRSEISRLHEAGIRGVRFNFLTRLVDVSPTDELRELARRIEPWGWHVVIYFEASDLPELEGFFSSLPVPLVVDHLGRPDLSKDVNGPEFARFLRFASRDDVWVKVSCPERLTLTGPSAVNRERAPYVDVVPFATKTVEEFGDRVLWGSDWPHPNLTDHMPDDGLLVDFIPRIASTEIQQRRLLVDNPTRLYWPGENG